MNRQLHDDLKSRLLCVLEEIETQREVSKLYPPEVLPFSDEMKQIREYLEVAGEFGLAYEVLVASLETHPFKLSAKAVIALLEAGLLMGYKTDRPSDGRFDRRKA